MALKQNQLTLDVALHEGQRFDGFYPGENGQLLELLKQVSGAVPGGDAKSDSAAFWIYLHGPSGSGRSHLLMAACAQAQEAGQRALYLPLKDLAGYADRAMGFVEGLENMDLLALDDVDSIAGSEAWEVALFSLLNRLFDAGRKVLVAGKDKPERLGFIRPDIASRLNWGMRFQVRPLNDADLQKALILKAHQRGVTLSEEVARYIINRKSRDWATLAPLLDELDQASLQAKRKLNLAFVRSVLRGD